MKYVIVVAAGMADEPQGFPEGATPLEVARTPNLDALAATGRVGLVRTIPQEFGDDPGAAVFSILGYDPKRHYEGRGAWEAAGAGLSLEPDEWGVRCDLVTVHEGKLIDFAAGHVGTPEAEELLKALNEQIDASTVRLAAGLGYRNAMAVRPKGAFEVTCTSPQSAIGRPVDECVPQGEGASILSDVMNASVRVFADHEVNRVRADLDENPATMLWPWGPSRKRDLPPFSSLHKLSGAVVCAVNYVRGIAESAGCRSVPVGGATGHYDTDYAAKARAAIDALEDADIVLVHVEAPAEASLEGDVRQKVRCIEDVDLMLVAPLREWAEADTDRRLMVLPDCAVHVSSQQYGSEPVPFVISKPRFSAARSVPFTEKGAAVSALYVSDGHELLQYFLRT